MNPARVDAWRSFFDRVVRHAEDWPRDVWLAAVEDGLRAALPPGSPLLDAHRQDVAELTELERETDGSALAETRIGQLRAQIDRRIGLVDQVMGESSPAAEKAPARALAKAWRMPLMRIPARGLVAGFAFGAATFLLGLVAASHLYDVRLSTQVQGKLDAFAHDVDLRVADLEAELGARLTDAQQLKSQLHVLNEDVAANVEKFSATVADSKDSMTALRDDAIIQLERRLAMHGGDIAERLGDLRQHADGLGRGLSEVSRELAEVKEHLPTAGGRLEGLTDRLQEAQAEVEHTQRELAAIQGSGAVLVTRLEREGEHLGQALDERRSALDQLSVQIAELQRAAEQSKRALDDFGRSLGKGRQTTRL